MLAFRGTDDLFDGLVDDAMIGLGAAPMQALAALVVAQVGGLKQSAYITGHSLGGALAVIAAAQTGRAAVTFNAPGVMDSCMLVSGVGLSKGVKGLFEMMARCVANARVWNVRIGGDVVSSKLTTGSQPGRTKVITQQDGMNAVITPRSSPRSPVPAGLCATLRRAVALPRGTSSTVCAGADG